MQVTGKLSGANESWSPLYYAARRGIGAQTTTLLTYAGDRKIRAHLRSVRDKRCFPNAEIDGVDGATSFAIGAAARGKRTADILPAYFRVTSR
jgi:hypothetical protein